MNFDENISMLSMAFYQVLLVSGPILALALGIGLFIGIIQAATSINEMTLSFVPKDLETHIDFFLADSFSTSLHKVPFNSRIKRCKLTPLFFLAKLILSNPHFGN